MRCGNIYGRKWKWDLNNSMGLKISSIGNRNGDCYMGMGLKNSSLQTSTVKVIWQTTRVDYHTMITCNNARYWHGQQWTWSTNCHTCDIELSHVWQWTVNVSHVSLNCHIRVCSVSHIWHWTVGYKHTNMSFLTNMFIRICQKYDGYILEWIKKMYQHFATF